MATEYPGLIIIPVQSVRSLIKNDPLVILAVKKTPQCQRRPEIVLNLAV
jgi:hypothetical protein